MSFVLVGKSRSHAGFCALRVFAVGLVATLVMACSANRHALGQNPPPPTPSGHVLLYTDNSPGAIVWAYAHLWAAHRQNFDVHVVTSTSAFESALPSKAWNHVIVAEKHSEGAPAYTPELSTFVDANGWAMIHRWKEDAESPPAANQVVSAPTASYVWANGDTAWSYYKCRLELEKASGISSGYITKSFNGVGMENASVVHPTGMPILEQGVVLASASIGPPPETCEERMWKAAENAEKEWARRKGECSKAYLPNPSAVPPYPGDPVKFKKCVTDALKAFNQDIEDAVNDYFVCEDIANPPPPQ